MGKLFPGREIKTLAVQKDGGGVEVRTWSMASKSAETVSVE